MRRTLIHPKERIDRMLATKVPDLGPIVREDKRPSAPRSQGRRDLVHERVAMHVNHIRPGDGLPRLEKDFRSGR